MLRDAVESIFASRTRARVLAFVFSLLPFTVCLSSIIVALVTLRKGGKAGADILIWAALPQFAFFAAFPALPVTLNILNLFLLSVDFGHGIKTR